MAVLVVLCSEVVRSAMIGLFSCMQGASGLEVAKHDWRWQQC